MSPVQPVDPRVRLAIAQWPSDAPRGSVTTFCLEHDLSRKTFYAIRKRAQLEGQAAALQPRTRRPSVSPNRISDDVKTAAIAVRAALEQSGLDHGPISVHDKMCVLGMEPVPVVSSLVRIFHEAGIARLESKKKPRASFRRFSHLVADVCGMSSAETLCLPFAHICGQTSQIIHRSIHRESLNSRGFWDTPAETGDADFGSNPTGSAKRKPRTSE